MSFSCLVVFNSVCDSCCCSVNLASWSSRKSPQKRKKSAMSNPDRPQESAVSRNSSNPFIFGDGLTGNPILTPPTSEPPVCTRCHCHEGHSNGMQPGSHALETNRPQLFDPFQPQTPPATAAPPPPSATSTASDSQNSSASESAAPPAEPRPSDDVRSEKREEVLEKTIAKVMKRCQGLGIIVFALTAAAATCAYRKSLSEPLESPVMLGLIPSHVQVWIHHVNWYFSVVLLQ